MSKADMPVVVGTVLKWCFKFSDAGFAMLTS